MIVNTENRLIQPYLHLLCTSSVHMYTDTLCDVSHPHHDPPSNMEIIRHLRKWLEPKAMDSWHFWKKKMNQRKSSWLQGQRGRFSSPAPRDRELQHLNVPTRERREEVVRKMLLSDLCCSNIPNEVVKERHFCPKIQAWKVLYYIMYIYIYSQHRSMYEISKYVNTNNTWFHCYKIWYNKSACLGYVAPF